MSDVHGGRQMTMGEIVEAEGGMPWLDRAMRAEAELARERDRIANTLRLLDEYRNGVAPMPTYAQLMRALQG